MFSLNYGIFSFEVYFSLKARDFAAFTPEKNEGCQTF
jgi:hypothetical protein